MSGPDRLLELVVERIAGYGAPSAVVAFSGGVDSATVAAAAARALGAERVTAITAVSPSLPSGELASARSLAATVGVRFEAVDTHEVELEPYARNDARRCFHCKVELYGALERSVGPASGRLDAALLNGTNADDAGDFRPGLLAARPFGVRSPLLEEGIGKDGVRAVARALGLEVADRPAMACLSSRVAFGVTITPELLARVDEAERRVRSLGFDVVRVRHLGEAARVEVAPDDVARLLDDPRLDELVAGLRAMGWDDVAVDPAGYRAGAMNATLVELRRRTPRARPGVSGPRAAR